ncbi:uncharacterized protein LOC128674319 [Plodia interpunctella]|uniref:uncharacterized protein LOC128674319 n=1 Tax=Plodia interpunctella TaxID=58824 RepID=UPI0023676943|nr:uncharacterized protein LOC128674319 [Plodia interpunctella]XP_053608787.1 uncharacterized protein LOC128674319 [Plodia interpunctella]XP_053608788.1 uncharacterized protein LOC128674319 [Plodia interpunctella]
MPNCKDTFNSKFRLLCSQESHDEINWSSTDSSDYENVSNIDNHITFHYKNRKRKRKQKAPKNISNLDITVVDITNDKDLSRTKKQDKSSVLLSQYHPPYTSVHMSPIICPRTIKSEGRCKSPILVLKTASLFSPKVKKKLFGNNENVNKINVKSPCPVPPAPLHCDGELTNDIILSKHFVNVASEEEYSKVNNEDNLNKSDCVGESSMLRENKNATKLDDSLDSLKSTKDWKLANRVKSYFDNIFSSESASQVSIQDSLTPKDSSKGSYKSSDDLDIVSCLTQINSNKSSTESFKDESDVMIQSKKIRYNKNGLAFRLNTMIKKHNASVSLWQHEQFLAANSNFVIPKGKHLVFIVRNVEIKYGCFLLHARNIESERFLILINNEYVNNCIFCKDMVLKVYEPFKILELNTDLKLVINVCKFQGEKLNNL